MVVDSRQFSGPETCDGCGQMLTHEEAEYYEYRCESCERAACQVEARDLLDEIPQDLANDPRYCSVELARFIDWENDVATPALEHNGWHVLSWHTGEQDSFGPLSRYARCKKNGQRIDFVYG